MKKNDFIIVAILVALMFGWMSFYPLLEQRFFPKPAPAQPAEQAGPPTASASADRALTGTPSALAANEAKQILEEPVPPSEPEERLMLYNNDIELTVSSYGGAVVSAVLKNYPETNADDSGPVVLDFESMPALRYEGLPVSAGKLERTADGLLYTSPLGDGRIFRRTLRLGGEYLLTINDSFINDRDLPWALPKLRLPTGFISNPADATSMKGISTLGIDTFTAAEGVHHWGKDLNRLFRDIPPGTDVMTSTPEMIAPQPIDWVAAKNKFFVQIITPETGADAFDISIRRDGEGKKAAPSAVAAALHFDPELIPGYETFTRTIEAYIGPKDFSFLKTQGMEQTEVMEFKSTGFFKFMNPVMFPLKKALLWGLTSLYAVFHNYGVAIMLLTIIVRVIFWPVTHKSTESMRKMQALQPQIKEIREKYKDNPQRMQQETMQFYKQNKVNPMGSCLPMVIQIPVFIALYTVLRSAIELRFSRFLWVRDLSEPENLFAGMIPIVGSLNILPILMAATMVWQQKITPSAGDPQQQKMMSLVMPIMMLFFFYGMPSGLVLYWTTSNLLMIIQMMIKKRKEA
jgi:YidC/Oxa1 family membrane protein insertase